MLERAVKLTGEQELVASFAQRLLLVVEQAGRQVLVLQMQVERLMVQRAAENKNRDQ